MVVLVLLKREPMQLPEANRLHDNCVSSRTRILIEHYFERSAMLLDATASKSHKIGNTMHNNYGLNCLPPIIARLISCNRLIYKVAMQVKNNRRIMN